MRLLRLLRLLGFLGLGAAVGAVTAFAGTAVHLEVAISGGVVWPVGLVLAVALVLLTDLALAVATRSAIAMLGDATGRAAVLVVAISPGPGGDILLMGGWRSEAWSLVAVLVPALAAPLLSMWSTVALVRASRRSVPGPSPSGDAPVPGAPPIGRQRSGR